MDLETQAQTRLSLTNFPYSFIPPSSVSQFSSVFLAELISKIPFGRLRIRLHSSALVSLFKVWRADLGMMVESSLVAAGLWRFGRQKS